MKIHKGDNVIVLAGKDKGATGTVERVLPADNKVVIEGMNVVQRHMRGQVIEKAMPIDASNVAVIDPKTKKATRVGYKVEDGKKVRVTRASGSVLK